MQYNLLQIIKKKLSAGQKIDELVKILENDILKRPLSNVSGENIAKGNMQHVYNLVEVLYELTKRYASHANDSHEEGSERVRSVLGIDHEFDDEDEEDNPQSNKDSPEHPSHKYEHLLEGQQIIEDKLNELRKHNHPEPKKSDDSSGFGEVLERRNYDIVSPLKPHQTYKSGKSLKQTIKKDIESKLFSNKTKKKLTTNLRNVISEKKLLSPKQRQFVNEAYQQISKARAELKPNDDYELVSRKQEEALERKVKQFKYTIKDHKERERLKGSQQNRKATLSTNNNLKKIHHLKVPQGLV